ncbi:MAG: ferrous iron transport protein B [Desulfurococcaceae archaeon]
MTDGALIRVALVGQPNVGKSALFNALTGGTADVTNWPGTTVAFQRGHARYGKVKIEVVDLPGAYALSPVTLEELVTRNYLLAERPDVVIVLVDSTLPERTLHMLVQVLELTPKVVVALTKWDLAHSMGIHINVDGLAKKIGVPVVPTSIKDKRSLELLLNEVVKVAREGTGRDVLRLDYGDLEEFVEELEKVLERAAKELGVSPRFIAVRLLEGDAELLERLRSLDPEAAKRASQTISEARRVLGDPARYVMSARASLARELASGNVARVRLGAERVPRILYNPWASAAIGIAFYVAIFIAAFVVSTGYPLNVLLSSLGLEEAAGIVESYSLSGLVEQALDWASSTISAALGSGLLTSFLVDGVLGSIGAVLVFVPPILVLMAFVAAVDDSGLGPRLAVGLHGLTSRIGLSGNALFPLLTGFACNVPAAMASRPLPSARERLRFLLTISFIPCQARLIVLLALSSAIAWGMGGVAVALSYVVAVAAFALANYVLFALDRARKVEELGPQMLLELPPLHRPLPQVVWWKVKAVLRQFLKRAGVVIFVAGVLVWALLQIGPGLELVEDPGQSLAGIAAKHLAFLVAPLGIAGGSAWIVTLALIAGFVAKEIVASTLVVATGATTVQEAIASLGLTTPQLVAAMFFVTLYTPCLATVATIYGETRSAKYTALSVLISFAFAYAFSSLGYAIASLLAA